MTDELIGLDAIGLSELIRRGEIKPMELLELTIKRIEKVNPKLNAVIHKMYDEAHQVVEKYYPPKPDPQSFESPFCGIPFFLKDLIAEYKGVPFNEGSRAVKGYVSKDDSELVRRHKAGGLIIVGKTNTPEFGLLPTTEPLLFGPTINPWDPTLTPGGSSGGSAAAVASGIVPMAHGNDAGGSIRVPASCCGLFGLKPTRGRNPLGPLFGDIGSGVVHEHAVTRSVRDSAALLDVTSGADIGDPYHAPYQGFSFLEQVNQQVGRLKIGFLSSIPEGWHEEAYVHPDSQAAVKDAGLLCESLGHIVEEITAEQLGYPSLMSSFGCIFSCLTGRMISYWEKSLNKQIMQGQVEPNTWATYQAGLRRTGADYLGALEDLQRFSRKIAQWFHRGGYDIILSPTISIPHVKLGSMQGTPDDPRKGLKMVRAFVAFTLVYNVTGQPAMSVPLFWNKNNLPIGVQFAGRFGEENTLFRLAAQLEQARPWAQRKPPIHCSE